MHRTWNTESYNRMLEKAKKKERNLWNVVINPLLFLHTIQNHSVWYLNSSIKCECEPKKKIEKENFTLASFIPLSLPFCSKWNKFRIFVTTPSKIEEDNMDKWFTISFVCILFISISISFRFVCVLLFDKIQCRIFGTWTIFTFSQFQIYKYIHPWTTIRTHTHTCTHIYETL